MVLVVVLVVVVLVVVVVVVDGVGVGFDIGWVGKTKILKHTQFLCQF